MEAGSDVSRTDPVTFGQRLSFWGSSRPKSSEDLVVGVKKSRDGRRTVGMAHFMMMILVVPSTLYQVLGTKYVLPHTRYNQDSV